MITSHAIKFFTFLHFTKSLRSNNRTFSMNSSAGIFSVAFTTVPKTTDADVAKKLAHGLVSNKLAACVNIIPKVISVYKWKNEINEDEELLLMIKTRTDTVDAVTQFIKKNHPYEVAEIISLPIQNGNELYLEWISKVVPPINQLKD